jgi:ABC-2 type transport system ATP-binding protein
MIEAQSLTKRFRATTVVDDVSFRCEPGTVTGFLGPNGAGKTTTMRMLCGLSRPDAGHAAVLGGPYRELPNPGRRVGILLDASAQHAGRRGCEALAVSAQMMGVDARRVQSLLDLVGLDRAAARKRVRQYSLGMRQRLGIAHALLGEPEVLILDEPANGLDPSGIRWMRGLLRDYADRGGTVLLSSHLLHEIEVIADDLVVIGNGRIVAQGAKKELLQTAGSFVRATERDVLARALAESGVSSTPDGVDALRASGDAEQVGRIAFAAGVPVVELRPADGAGLEEMFLELTSETQRDTRAEGAAA